MSSEGRGRSRSPHPGGRAPGGLDEETLTDLAAEFEREGCIFPRMKLLSEAELDAAEALLKRLVAERPKDLAPEDLMNLHMTNAAVLKLCRHPRVVEMAKALLQTSDVSIFTSRILCKESGTGKEIPWHQDSNYWPLVPPGSDVVRPDVASIWLPLDDVDEANGAMQVLPFSAQPETKGRNCTELIQDSGGSTHGFDNFNLSVDGSKLNVMGARLCCIKRGMCEWHSAWTVHRSDPNKSPRRRLVWIVRYCATGTSIRPGVRGSFDETFPIVPAGGRGCDRGPVREGEDLYAPCFGNAKTMKALKV